MKLKKNNLNNKKIAIYGGTFNPIHIGHLITALYIKEKLNYDYILFIPANIPVHKDIKDIIPPTHRINMVKLAIKGIPFFLYSDMEIKRGGLSYTYDTVLEIKEINKSIAQIGIIFGDDLLDGLESWKNIEKLQEISELICLTRDESIIRESNFKVNFIKNKIVEISSTEIRKRINNGLTVKYMLPDNVKNYILKNNLYRDK